MDWPRAKTILIISFLVLDLYLAYLLFYVPGLRAAPQQLGTEDIENLMRLSKHYNVELLVFPKPLQVHPLPDIALQELMLDKDAVQTIARLWLGLNYTSTLEEDEALLFEAGERSLRISQASLACYNLQYQDAAADGNDISGTNQEAIATAKDFLAQHLGSEQAAHYQANMVIKNPMQHGHVVELSRMHKGLPVFMDSYRFLISGGCVSAFTARQASVGKPLGTKQSLVDAQQAMKRYLAQLGTPRQESIAVLDVALGYYLMPNQTDELQMTPVWRFYTTDPMQEEVFIPANQTHWEHLTP